MAGSSEPAFLFLDTKTELLLRWIIHLLLQQPLILLPVSRHMRGDTKHVVVLDDE